MSSFFPFFFNLECKFCYAVRMFQNYFKVNFSLRLLSSMIFFSIFYVNKFSIMENNSESIAE